MTGPGSIEEYLAALPKESRAALEDLRKTIKSAAPDASATIAYQMPAYRQYGRFLVSFAAFRNHCSLFPASQAVMDAHGEALKPYVSGKGTLRFRPDEPIPTALVKKIVKTRIAEVAAQKDR